MLLTKMPPSLFIFLNWCVLEGDEYDISRFWSSRVGDGGATSTAQILFLRFLLADIGSTDSDKWLDVGGGDTDLCLTGTLECDCFLLTWFIGEEWCKFWWLKIDPVESNVSCVGWFWPPLSLPNNCEDDEWNDGDFCCSWCCCDREQCPSFLSIFVEVEESADEL